MDITRSQPQRTRFQTRRCCVLGTLMMVIFLAGCGTDSPVDTLQGTWQDTKSEPAGRFLKVSNTGGQRTAEIIAPNEWDARQYERKVYPLVEKDGALSVQRPYALIPIIYDDAADELILWGDKRYKRLTEEEARSSMEAISKQDAIYDAEDKLCDELQEEITTRKANVETEEEWSSFLDSVDERRPGSCTLIGDERGF